jgi:hypothetical protein
VGEREAVGVVPGADPVGVAPRVGARHDPYGKIVRLSSRFWGQGQSLRLWLTIQADRGKAGPYDYG